MSVDVLAISDEELQRIKTDKITETKRLTDWVKEPSINELKHDLTQAKNSLSDYVAKLDNWVNLYNAPKFGDSKHKGSRIVPKLVRKQAEWNAPALSEPFLSTTELFDVRALTFEDVPRAKQNALILNNQFNTKLNKVKLVDKVIRQLVKHGSCIVRTGWEYQEKEVEEYVEEFEYSVVEQPMVNPMDMMTQMGGMEQPQDGGTPLEQEPSEFDLLSQEYEKLAQLRQAEPDTYEQLPSELKAGFEMSEQEGQLIKAVSIGFKKEKVVKPISNKPTAEICNIKNIYIDPTCKDDIDKAQFIIHAYESSLSDLKKSGQYKNIDTLSELVSNKDWSIHDTSDFMFADKARRKLVVYEYWGYWDIHGKGETTAIVATWVGDTLIRLEENPFPDGKPPFVIFNYIPEDDSVYGIPNAEILEDNQNILGAVMRGTIDLMGKSANSQTGYAKNFLDATNKAKFMKGQDYEYNQNFDPRVHVHQHKYPEIPNSAMNIIAMMNNEAESLSGVKAFSGTGISASNLGDVAVGVRGVLDAVSKREMSILRRISDGFIALGRKIISMNSEFLSEEEVVRITNNEFVKVRRDDLAGEFDLVLTISTAEADDAKAKEIAFMLQTIGNSQGQELNQMMLSEIFELRKMPDLAKQVREYKAEPDPMAQKMQELEIAKLEAEIEMMKAEAMERQAKAQVQMAKVGVEEARAESLQGDADNKVLDFMERDSGMKHQQDLAKQAMINQGSLEREQLRADNQLNMVNQKQMNDLTNQIVSQELSPHDKFQQMGINQ
ncbi:portal protein [Moraxella bovis]|uniref:Poly(3-hydroxybutyrate) depolymerase n=1 Tax=Moraxella bovis TaxID=476 RepID=A0ABY6M8P3_MORBO|nr:poly(3-hydroxybutyrate) depolymerase [Moraxella bovis]UZA02924.1 poly(3-hydroxybutyrate) depolymerase [Moraxella bovis]UZA19139.1 poly(3-hydroxybutyrate) depolymerase [Moraxella bovis]UZA54018.1 poly(3-hydroxybutyrate) depolymerase [Moraxella bovis]UZA57376.1 poly(3-hydroxybutyrate) depolymerase [Moraxella bovis]